MGYLVGDQVHGDGSASGFRWVGEWVSGWVGPFQGLTSIQLDPGDGVVHFLGHENMSGCPVASGRGNTSARGDGGRGATA